MCQYVLAPALFDVLHFNIVIVWLRFLVFYSSQTVLWKEKRILSFSFARWIIPLLTPSQIRYNALDYILPFFSGIEM